MWSKNNTCDKDGQCDCEEGWNGLKCDKRMKPTDDPLSEHECCNTVELSFNPSVGTNIYSQYAHLAGTYQLSQYKKDQYSHFSNAIGYLWKCRRDWYIDEEVTYNPMEGLYGCMGSISSSRQVSGYIGGGYLLTTTNHKKCPEDVVAWYIKGESVANKEFMYIKCQG